MPLPPPPRRLLIVDRDRDALAAWIAARTTGIEIRTADRNTLTATELAWADAYTGFRPPPDADLDGVAWVHCTGAGVDAFLFRRRFPAGTLLTRTDEPFGAQIGEWAASRVLAVAQGIVPYREDQRARRWAPKEVRTVRGTRALVLGTGEVGRGVAAALIALGCQVHGISRSGAPCPPFASVLPVDALGDAVVQAQWIVLTLPLTEATWHLVDETILARCRGAVLLNAGRGALVDEAAILPALDAGHLSAAALDVFEVEPLPAGSPLWEDPRVLVSPHVAGLTTVAGAGASFLRVYQDLAAGRVPGLAVDPGRGY